MSAIPTLPKGTRDFYGKTLQKRQFIINTITHIFHLYGFQPLETPAMENTQTLMGKYGDEGDKLIFRILNNGLTSHDFQHLPNIKQTLPLISEKALRYDLTIPFARFVANNIASLPLPFKRYQVQPVWRGDRPQKGRYREFYQCDADLVGSTSLLCEVEFVQIYQHVFAALQIPQTTIHINSRKILSALLQKIDAPQFQQDIMIGIDKIDKIGAQAVLQELQPKLSQQQIQSLADFLLIDGKDPLAFQHLQHFFQSSPLGLQGIADLQTIFQATHKHPISLQLDTNLARGLSYYTGAIFEVKTKAVPMGSLGGGGRYDNLTANMGIDNLSGIGISFGIDRIYDVMHDLDIFPQHLQQTTQILFFNMGDQETQQAASLATQLRLQNISCELYYDKAKLDKQFKYAQKKAIPFVVIIGTQELQTQTAILKNLQTGAQTLIPFAQFSNIASFLH